MHGAGASSSLPGTPSIPELLPLQSLGVLALQLLANELRNAPLPRAPGVLPSWLSMWPADWMPTLLWVLPKGDSAETGLQTEALSVLPAQAGGGLFLVERMEGASHCQGRKPNEH